MILRPGVVAVDVLALVVLFSAFCYALGSVLTKELVRTEPPDLVVLHMNLFGVLFFAVPTYLYWVPPTIEDWVLLVGLGAVTMFAHICYTHGMAAAEAGYLFAFEFLRLPLAALAGLVLFAEVPDIWTGAGALIIFGATYYIVQRERRVESAAGKRED